MGTVVCVSVELVMKGYNFDKEILMFLFVFDSFKVCFSLVTLVVFIYFAKGAYFKLMNVAFYHVYTINLMFCNKLCILVSYNLLWLSYSQPAFHGHCFMFCKIFVESYLVFC